MTEKKLRQKISPLQASVNVGEILLLRKAPFRGEKISCYAVPAPFRWTLVTAELWRLMTTCYLCLVHRPDVAVSMTLIFHGLHTYAARTLFGVPLIHHIMGKQDLQNQAPRRRLLQAFMWWFARRADVLVVRGEATRRLFVEKGGKSEDRVLVQHNVFDMSRYAGCGEPVKLYDLVYVGYLESYKRVDLLLDVAARVADGHPGLRLALAGEGGLRRRLERRVEELELVDNVAFLGWCDERRLLKVLRASRVFVMTSLGEGLSQAMIEAMACGLPVVIFDDADVREVVRPGENGILVPPEDVDAFSAAVEKLLADGEHYRQIAEGACGIHRELGLMATVEAQEKVWESAISRAMDREPSPPL